MKIIWTQEALENVIDIENYISEDNPSIVIEFTDLLINQCEYLKNNPDKGRVIPELSDPTIRELIYKNYRIVYRHIQKEIQILTVFERHRLLPLDH